jgi:hypothetical protein
MIERSIINRTKNGRKYSSFDGLEYDFSEFLLFDVENHRICQYERVRPTPVLHHEPSGKKKSVAW